DGAGLHRPDAATRLVRCAAAGPAAGSTAVAAAADLDVDPRQHLLRHRHPLDRWRGRTRRRRTLRRRPMSAGLAMSLAVLVPLVGAVLIALAGRWPALRDGVMLATAVALLLL